jgi:hypothetical protein
MGILSRNMLRLTAAAGLLAAWATGAAEPAQPIAEAVTAKEQLALRRLHHHAVEIFVDRPGFGVRRLVMNLDDLVTGPKSLGEANARPEQAVQETPAPQAEKPPAHYAVQDLLTGQAGRFPTDDGKETWQLRTVHLVGLVKHAEPVVYLVDGHPTKRGEAPKAAKDIPTRAVDAFEKAALAALRAGEPLKAEKRGKGLRLVAPIFAGRRCTGCHDQGLLLGGFTYALERVAHDAEKDGVRPPRGR